MEPESRSVIRERWSDPELWDVVDEYREGEQLAEELLELLAEPELIAADERREAIWSNLWWAVRGVLWQERIALETRKLLLRAVAAVYRSAASAGVRESAALESLWNMVLYNRCPDADDEPTALLCQEVFDVLSGLLEVPSALVQIAALDGLERVRDPRTRRRLEDARPLFVERGVADMAAYVRGALRRPP